MTDNIDLKAKFERLKRVKEEAEGQASKDGDILSSEAKAAAKAQMERGGKALKDGLNRAKEAATNPENRERAKARVQNIEWKAKLPIFIGLALMAAGYAFMRFPVSVNDMPGATASVVAKPKPQPAVEVAPTPTPQAVQVVALAPKAEPVVAPKPQVQKAPPHVVAPSVPTPPAPVQVVQPEPKQAKTAKVRAPHPQARQEGVNALYPHSTKLDPKGVNAKYDQAQNNAALDAWASKLKQH